jgi:uncharacterized protein YndB with AHSA1/START domain
MPDRELVISRIIDAPRERVFKAWTTQLPQWWGPQMTGKIRPWAPGERPFVISSKNFEKSI